MTRTSLRLLSIAVAYLVLCPRVETWAQVAGNALWFDGVGDEVDVPNAPTLSFGADDQFTVELWFRLASPRSLYHVIGKREDCYTLNYQLGVDNGRLEFGTGLSPALVATLDSTPTSWTHVAFVHDVGSSRLYIFGLEKAVGAVVVTGETPAVLRIGQSGVCGPELSFPGWIDEVRIWNVARTESEIQASYNRIVEPNTPGLVGYWSFDEDPASQVVYDLSGSGNDGTLGADAQAGVDDPTRVLSTAPLVCWGEACPYAASDANCDGVTDILDVVASINSAFRGAPQPPPCCTTR